jgi:hypothetical protein
MQVRDVPGLPKALYDVIENEFALTTSTVVKQSASKDGSTTKMLVKLQVGRFRAPGLEVAASVRRPYSTSHRSRWTVFSGFANADILHRPHLIALLFVGGCFCRMATWLSR